MPNTEELQIVGLILGMLFLLAVLMVMYLNGSFTYRDEIYSIERYKKTELYPWGYPSVYYVEHIVIKRTFVSGRIKFITKEVKI
jgi:hypothetical protein